MTVPERYDVPPPKYESLWDRAILQLDEESQSIVKEFQIGGCKPDQLLTDVHTEVEKCKKKQWHIYITNRGRRIFVRDVFKRVTGFLEKVTIVGDAVAQYDPVHLSLPWALARFLLIAAVSDIKSFGAMLESMEMVTDVVARYAVIEGIFLRPGSEFFYEIGKAITGLYVAVLTYICKAKCYFRRNTLIRIGISVLEVEKDATKFMQQISDEEDKVKEWVQTGNTNHIFDIYTRTNFMREDLAQLKVSADESSTKLQAMLLEMEKPVCRMADQLENMQCGLEKDERAKIIKWISSLGTDFEKNHRSISNNRLKNSGCWLINTQKFRRWINCSSCSVLWLYGGAGYGKSFLVSLVIDLMLQERVENPETAHLAYFYCTRDTADPKRAQPVEILRSIVRQLSCQTSRLPIRKPVLDKWYCRVDADSDAQLDIDECVEVLLELTRNNPAVICIDALDECDVATRRLLLKAIGRLVKYSEQIVKIFVSSRREDDFLHYFEKWESLQISATDNREDIINFVDEELKKSLANRTLLHGDASPRLLKEIRETLLDRADGMFRWVSACLQSLCDPLNTVEEDIREALRVLPKELEEVYGKICEQIERRPAASRKMAENAVRWLLCGKQPLSCEEMIKAILPNSKTPTASITKEQILSICCNFVKIDDEVGIFRFVHLSVREYLEKRHDYEMALNHSIVALACLTVCSTNVKPKRRGTLNNPSNKTFYDYAQVYWPIHCQNSKQYRRKEPLETLFRAFLCGGKWATKEFADWSVRWMESWTQMELETRIGSEEGDLYNQLADTWGQWGFCEPVYVACTFGFTEVIEDRRQAGMGQRDSKARNRLGRDLYGTAVRYGQKEIVNLLRSTTKLDSPAAKESALLAAVSLGELNMVTMLLKESPDLAITNETVEAAAANCDVNMMRFLSEEYFDFTVTEQLLLVAAENESHGHEVIPFLFEQSAEDIDQLDKSDLLQKACSNSRRGYEILQYILDNSERTSIAPEVVQAAASNDTDAYQMLKSLFKFDSAIQVTEEIVQAAARNANAEPIRLLLSHAPRLTITWQIATAAMQNKDCGDEILLLLLDSSKESFNIDEDMLLAAVTNRKLAVAILDILLPRCDHTCITNEVLQAASRNRFLGELLIIRILKHAPDMRLMAIDIEAAASNLYYAPEVLRELLDFDKHVPITTEALEEAAMNDECGAEALELLLIHRASGGPANIPTMPTDVSPSDVVHPFDIPPSVVEVAASNIDSGVEVMELLLRYDSDLSITPKAVENAAANPQRGEEIINLWQKHSKKLDISAQAIQEAAKNQNIGLQVMKLLLRCDKTTPISDDAMEAAAANPYQGLAMVKLMLPRWKSSARWEQVFSGASRNAPMGISIMKYLISRRAPAISSDIIESCALSSFVDADQIITLLNASPGTALEPEIVEAASFYPHQFFEILAALRARDPNVPISDAALHLIIQKSYNVTETIEMLLKYKTNLTITESLLKTIVQNFTANESIILYLSEYQKTHGKNAGSIPVTEEIIAAALQSTGTGAVSLTKILLKLAPGTWDADVNEKRLQIAAGAYKSDVMIQLLVEHAREQGHVLSITSKILIEAAGNGMSATSPLKLLLRLLPQSQQDIILTPEILTAAAKNRGGNSTFKMLMAYAKERDVDLQISDSLFNTAVSRGSYDTVQTMLRFWREQGKANLNLMITEKTLEEAALRIDYSTGRIENTIYHHLLKTLSQEGITIPITARIFQAALNSRTRFAAGLNVISYFRRICRIQGLEFSDLITSQSIISISGSDYHTIFIKLLSCLSESKRKELLTDEVVLGVAGNGASEALSYLLSVKPYPFLHPPSYYLRISAFKQANWSIRLGNQQALLKNGVFPNAVLSTTGRTLLSYSAEFNELCSVRALLKHGKGVDVNHKGDLGKTALHYACENGHISVVEMLLRAGVDKGIKDNQGWTAVDAAVDKGNLMIARLVRDWDEGREEGIH